MGGKGGGGGSSQQNYSTTQIPDWLSQAGQTAVSRAEDLSNQPYQAYGGQLVAQPGADTTQAYQQIRDMQGATAPAFQQAQGAWGNVLGNLQSLTPEQQNAITNQLYGNYGQQVMQPAMGLFGQYLGQGPATAQQVANNALTIMSPYSQAVIDPALKIGQQQLAQNLQNIGAQANQAGAFGGARQGVIEGVAQSQAALGAGQLIGNLLQSGWNTAMTPATQVALQGGQQGYGAAGALASLGQGGYNTAAQQAQAMQGANLGLGTQAAQQMPGLALQQQQEAQKEASLLQTIGAAQQNQQQAQLNAAYGQWQQQQNWPYQQLQTLLSPLSAIPYDTTSMGYSTGSQQQSRNAMAGALGGAASGASIGAMIPGVGPLIGAAAGGILGAL